MKDSHFDNILNDCLERIAAGESVAECLARYPEQAEALLPLLRMGQATMHAAHVSVPSPTSKARGKARMQAALATNRQRRSKRLKFPRIFWRPISTPMLAAFAAVFLTVVAAGGTTVASGSSIPGETLYPIKSVKEKVEECIARSSEHKAQVHAKLARERGREMHELIRKGRIHDAEVVAFRLNQHLNQSANHIGVVVPSHFIEMPKVSAHHNHQSSAAELKHRLSDDEAYVKGQLIAIVKDVPEPHKQRIWRLMHQSNLGYRVLIVALDRDGESKSQRYYGYHDNLDRIRIPEPESGQR